jgi:hypothetical protein
MTNVKDAPKTATTIVIRSDINSKISLSKDPFSAIMRRVFQTEKTAMAGRQFIELIEERRDAGKPLNVDEYEDIMEQLGLKRGSYYSMRNKLLGAGLIYVKDREFRLSRQFSLDLIDMARWWKDAVINKGEKGKKEKKDKN